MIVGSLTIPKQSNIQTGESLEGARGEVDRGRVFAGRAGVCHDNIDMLALPSNPDLLATVGGLGAGVSIGTGVESSDKVVVRVHRATGTSDAILSEPGNTEIWVRR